MSVFITKENILDYKNNKSKLLYFKTTFQTKLQYCVNLSKLVIIDNRVVLFTR